MSENDSKNNSINNILQSIFISVDDKIIPIISSSEKLSSIISFLTEESNIINNKIKLLSSLTLIFSKNKQLIHFFIKNCKTEDINLLEIIINIYFIENLEMENKKIIENLLNLIIENTSISKSIYEFVYQKLSFFYIDNNITKINEEFLLKTFKILQIFYKDPNQIEQNLDNNEYIKNNTKDSNNIIDTKEEGKDNNYYFYFNGKGSSFSFTLNRNSININSTFPTLENGCTLIFWMYLDKELTEKYFNFYKNIKINLITINIAGQQIKLIFENVNTFSLEVEETNSNPIDISTRFKYNSWNNICFLIEKKNKLFIIKMIINGYEYTTCSLPLKKEFPITEPIDTIRLFENFLGKISTIF